MKPLLVGEAPSRTSDPAVPFSGRSGDRLRELLGRPLEDAFEIRNLLAEWPGAAAKGSAWDRGAARERAVEITRLDWYRGRLLVAVGRRVARAFALPALPYLEVVGEKYPAAVLPHPSGVDRWFNDPQNVEAARAFLRSLA